MIKAINTKYKNYNFRSRTEARWAIFLDRMGVSWEYEIEGFEFSDGTRYLPDFYLTVQYPDKTMKMWVEVKGTYPSTYEIKKLHALGKESKTLCLFFIGTPGKHQIYLCNQFSEVEDCMEEVGLTDESIERMLGHYRDTEDDFFNRHPLKTIVSEAIISASCARFEFGETP